MLGLTPDPTPQPQQLPLSPVDPYTPHVLSWFPKSGGGRRVQAGGDWHWGRGTPGTSPWRDTLRKSWTQGTCEHLFTSATS